jgi:hypothetical protein
MTDQWGPEFPWVPEPPYEPADFGGIAIACGGNAGENERAGWKSWVDVALETINSRPKGATLLRSIARDGRPFKHKILVCYSEEDHHTKMLDQDNARWLIPNRIPGLGSVAVIYWQPTGAPNFPGFVVLAHELIHARRVLLGISHHDIRTEEMITVGLRGDEHGPKRRRITRNEELRLGVEAVTENDIRAEHGLPRRTQYTLRDGKVLQE